MNLPESIFKKNWWKSKTLALAVCLLREANWPKNKVLLTSALQLSKKMDCDWRTIFRELAVLCDSGFIEMENVLDNGIKKLKIKIVGK